MTREPETELTSQTALAILQTLEGRENGLRARDLVEAITGEKSTPKRERHLRQCITQLRMFGHPICATPDDGYFWGMTDEEINATARNLTSRSMTGLTLAARMTGRNVEDLASEYALKMEGVGDE